MTEKIYLKKQNKLKYLVIGEFQSGKTSLINLIYMNSKNFTLEKLKSNTKIMVSNMNFEGKFQDCSKQSKGETTKTNPYEVCPKYKEDLCQIEILDTPGLGGAFFSEKIKKEISNFAKELTGIILVLNGTITRIHEQVRQALAQCQSLIPNENLDKFIIILSNTKFKTANLDINQALSGLKIKYRKIFLYDNNIFQYNRKELNNPDIVKSFNLLNKTSESIIEAMINIKSLSVVGPIDEKEEQKFNLLEEKTQQMSAELFENPVLHENLKRTNSQHSQKMTKNFSIHEHNLYACLATAFHPNYTELLQEIDVNPSTYARAADHIKHLICYLISSHESFIESPDLQQRYDNLTGLHPKEELSDLKFIAEFYGTKIKVILDQNDKSHEPSIYDEGNHLKMIVLRGKDNMGKLEIDLLAKKSKKLVKCIFEKGEDISFS
jgi:hypothetical protein